MPEYRLGRVESRFAEIIWARAPLSSGELVAICREELGWQKSTTYTVLRRLCQKGLFENRDGEIRVLVGREDFLTGQSEDVLQESYAGSLPRFVAAFTARNRLSDAEIRELEQLIREQKEGRK